MITPRFVLITIALIGQAAIAQAQGAFPAPLPGGQAAAPPPPMSAGPSAAPPPMTAAPAPSSFPSPTGGGFSAPMGGSFSAAPQQQPGPSANAQACQTEFVALKKDAEKKAAAIAAASKRKASPQEACKLIGTFLASEVKMIKYVESNVQRCGIPPNAAAGMKKGHLNSVQLEKKICAAAANTAQQGAPPAPSLSEALGSASLPETKATKRSGGSTFDTLSGNVLSR